jgi:hypothetical protein
MTLESDMEKKGFVAIFGQPLVKPRVCECVDSWLERFEKVEQIAPANEFTLEVKETRDILWDANLQFRVSNGDQFAWIYVSLDKAAMETTGFADAEISFCLEVLLELPDVTEIVDEKNQRRLEQLEKAGMI